MNNNTILALVFLMAGTLLTAAVTTIGVPAAYAEGDDHDDYNGDGNKNKAEDESQAALADCDNNDVEQAGFDCVAVAEIEEGGGGMTVATPITPSTTEAEEEEEEEEEE
jgi:hypothetical protein